LTADFFYPPEAYAEFFLFIGGMTLAVWAVERIYGKQAQDSPEEMHRQD